MREGEEDADTDDYLPIPRAKPIRKGKQTTIHNEDEDDDGRIVDPIDATPISWLPPCVPAKEDIQGTSRKRADAPGSDSPKAKRIKKSGSKLNRVKPMPTTKG